MNIVITLLVSFFAYILLQFLPYFYQPLARKLRYLGTAAPYRFVANTDDHEIKYKGCEPTKIWLISRHGTRYPDKDDADEMTNRLPVLRDSILNGKNELLRPELKLFKNWTAPIVNIMYLTEEGANEMRTLAERMQARFPSILLPDYSNTTYKFKFTNTQRTNASASNFAIGLFGEEDAKEVWYPAAEDKDPILRFYKLCRKWLDEVKKNSDSLIELEKFKRSTEVRAALAAAEKKLGLADLTFDDLSAMYTACAFETAWNQYKSPWCSAFDLDGIKVMEYTEDLKYYWHDGYGYEITYKQACPAFNDMFDFMKDPDMELRSTLYFTHSGTLLKIIAHLGLHKDLEPILHDNMDDGRHWKVNEIDSFGTNLAFVSFRCEFEDKILLLHQENIVRFPCCLNDDLCSFADIEEYYSESVNDCNFDQMCENTVNMTKN